MNIEALLAELKQKGIEVRLVDGQPKVIGPRALLTDDLVATLRQHKAELVALLSRPQDSTPDRPCPACGGLRYWLRPSGGWVCSQCHPAPVEDVPEVIVLRDIRKALQDAVIELAEAASWPRLQLDQAVAVAAGRGAWVAFVGTGDVAKLRLAIEALKGGLGNGANSD